MAITTLSFKGNINASIQKGDHIYYSSTPTELGGISLSQNEIDNGNSEIKYFGKVHDINIQDVLFQASNLNINFQIYVIHASGVEQPGVGSFIFFTKDSSVNMSSMIGYYGSFKFENNSRTKSELFATTCNIAQSSK
tara:strand:+ start:558 stop:968 length:411 start_codon:yes stop_codon:yes gene_type:complete